MNIFIDDVIFGHGTQPYAHTTLGDIFESNELFTAYPQLNENGRAIIWNDYLVDTENSGASHEQGINTEKFLHNDDNKYFAVAMLKNSYAKRRHVQQN